MMCLRLVDLLLLLLLLPELAVDILGPRRANQVSPIAEETEALEGAVAGAEPLVSDRGQWVMQLLPTAQQTSSTCGPPR